MGFPHNSVGKESTCNAGDPGSIPGLGRSAGEGIDYQLQYSWASPVAQLVKNLPAMWKTWLQSLGWEDPLEKGKTIHSRILAWRIPGTVQSVGSQRVGYDCFSLSHALFCMVTKLPFYLTYHLDKKAIGMLIGKKWIRLFVCLFVFYFL